MLAAAAGSSLIGDTPLDWTIGELTTDSRAAGPDSVFVALVGENYDGNDFIDDARDVSRHGTLRNPDRPDQLLDQAAADKIRAYREPYHRHRSLAFLPACMSTSGRIHSEFLRLLYLIADKQASDYFADLDYEPHKEEFCHRRGVFFHQHRSTIGLACAQAVAIRGAPDAARRHASAPRALPLRVAYDDWDLNDFHERARA